MSMSETHGYQIRRAVLDDMPALIELWKLMQFPVEELSRRVTDFQVAVDPQGELVGAIAILVSGRQGLVHSEGFPDFGLADQLRPRLWQRIQSLAANHGLSRLWTREEAPFWHHCGFHTASPEDLQKMPSGWKSPDPWLTIKLREDLDEVLSSDRTVALFMEQQKAESERVLAQARLLKSITVGLGLLVFIAIIAAAFVVFMKMPGLRVR